MVLWMAVAMLTQAHGGPGLRKAETALDCVRVVSGSRGKAVVGRSRGKHHIVHRDRLETYTVRLQGRNSDNCRALLDTTTQVEMSVGVVGGVSTDPEVWEVFEGRLVSSPFGGILVYDALLNAADPNMVALDAGTQSSATVRYDVHVKLTVGEESSEFVLHRDLLVDLDGVRSELSVVSQPARVGVMALSCRDLFGASNGAALAGASTDTVAHACLERPGTAKLVDSVVTAPLALRFRYVVSPRYDWVAWGVDLSAISLGSTGVFVDIGEPEAVDTISGIQLRSELDLTTGVDFKIDADSTRVNVMVGGGLAMAQFGAGPIRPRPFMAMNLSTPILVARKKRWNGEPSVVAASVEGKLIELEAMIDQLPVGLGASVGVCGTVEECGLALGQLAEHRGIVEAWLQEIESALDEAGNIARTTTAEVQRLALVNEYWQAKNGIEQSYQAELAGLCSTGAGFGGFAHGDCP